ncbi:MAG: T9SS type A sorting domain-containing protein [Gemmatimonadetes bacterium]|nr:T9SS type A sorting domain-containing protein [Gemmatimonadota bacterium]MDE3259938.1 T9SS type A sorting domain-containing protein [Gemmatimonadota bacterium]
MMKARTLFASASMIPAICLLVLAGVCTNAPRALAACPLPPGVTPPDDPPVTARQVEDGSASLRGFALAARDRYRIPISTLEGALYFQCLVRQEGSPWRSGSTYIVSLTPDGRVYEHARAMAFSGRLLNPLIYAEILSALGVEPAVLANLASTDPAVAAQAFGAVMSTLSQEPDGAFDATNPVPGLRPGIPGASGHVATYLVGDSPIPTVLLVGFDLNESHLVPISDEAIDYGDPAVTARDVVDRKTLKAFVTGAGEWFVTLAETATDPAAISKARIAARDPKGPWRHGPVYLYVLELTSNTIMFHAAFPDRFEWRPLVPTVRDAVTGWLILPQVIDAAQSSPEGGFVEYYFDDPTDDTDSADIPKVGFAREFTATIGRPDGTAFTLNLIVGSGFYGRAPDVVAMGPRTEVEAKVLGDAVEGLDVEFSRAIAGRQSDYDWSAVTDAAGMFSLTISNENGVSGYYRARATNADGEVVGRWSSIPLNEGRRQVLVLTLGGGMRVVRVEALSASGPAVASKAAFGAAAVPEASGLSPNVPNPFNSATLITYHLSIAGPVKLVIYNVLGQPVRTLVDEFRAAGSYQIRWDARDQLGASLSTGVYIARMSYPGGAQTQRLLYLK